MVGNCWNEKTRDRSATHDLHWVTFSSLKGEPFALRTHYECGGRGVGGAHACL